MGWFKWPNLIGLCFAAVAFIVVPYIIRYTKECYEKRKIPRSWKFILFGLATTAIAEAGEMLCYYEWPNADLIEANLILAIPHALGGTFIGLCAYFMYKELLS